MARRGREKAAKDPDKAQALIAQAGSIDGMTAKRILDGVREGDPFCCDLWRGIAEDFGRGFASIYHALDPDLIVLGGGVPQAGEVFFDSVRRETEARVLPQFRGEVRIVPAALGTDSVLFGALALALQLD
jgi:glucokinase